jgi:phosphoribosylglycinamide formyltransferase-1
MKLHLGVLASHSGTNLQAIIDACKEGRLDASVRVVVSNNSGAMALERAKREGIPWYHLSSATHPEPDNLDGAILNALQSHDVDLVILAGYMKKLGHQTLSRFQNRILNSHPALLPKYGGKGMYGSRVHEAVLSAGERVTGVTIHIVDEEYDHGPAVAQCRIPVREGDTVESLEERVKERERGFWIEVLQKLAMGELDLDNIEQALTPSTREGRLGRGSSQ